MFFEGDRKFEQMPPRSRILSKFQDLAVKLTGNELGTEISGISKSGWHISHPRFDPAFKYEAIHPPITVDKGTTLRLPFKPIETKGKTYIRAYPRFGRVILRVHYDEAYYLRNRSNEEVDATAVMFTHPEANLVQYVGFRPSEYKGRVLAALLRKVASDGPEEPLPPSIQQYLDELGFKGI